LRGFFKNWGQKKFFRGALTPKPEVNLVEVAGGFVELGERYQTVKKFSKNSQGLPRYLGSKKNLCRHLAAKLEPLGAEGKGEWVEGIEDYNV